MSYATQQKKGDELNRLYEEDVPVHDWYRFVLSFPPHLIRDYGERFSISYQQRILDPFCGTGTTLVEAKKLGIPSIGIEANPVVHFAASVKTDWDVDTQGLEHYAEFVAKKAQSILDAQGIDYGPLFYQATAEPITLKTLNSAQERLLIKDSISPLPLHKVLTLLDVMEAHEDQRFSRYARLALAKQVVYSISNLRFGPEIGIGKIKKDAPVIQLWLQGIRGMAHDLRHIQLLPGAPVVVHLGDARQAASLIEPNSVDAVITS